MKGWLQVRKALGVMPIVEGEIGGAAPLHVDRYLFQGAEKSVPGLREMVLITHFGGSRVREGEPGQWRADSMPTQSLLVPAGYATHWHYSGTVDFAAFFFPERVEGIQDRLRLLVESRQEPMSFSDAVVGALAMQLAKELHKGASADESFMTVLAQVMLEQTYRVLTTPETGGINPRHVHFARLQKVLKYISEHLAEDLTAPVLADQAKVSVPHLRRLFQEAMGVALHRYILGSRLEQARKLLTLTTLPISRIAIDCGFSSQSHLTACFRTAHAATPAEFRAHVKRAA